MKLPKLFVVSDEHGEVFFADLEGDGLYMTRDNGVADEIARRCNMWDEIIDIFGRAKKLVSSPCIRNDMVCRILFYAEVSDLLARATEEPKEK